MAFDFALPSDFFPYRLIDQLSAALWLKRQLEHAAHDPADFVYDSTRKHLALENVGGHLRRMYRGIAATPIRP
ncbi:MAG: hypothetical protein J0H89_08500 [Rhizobiales bacterium]|nr:hypothetical protein [Hyphomicrobiales bacterium]